MNNMENTLNDYLPTAFDDVLLVPKFSSVSSRRETYTGIKLFGIDFKLPIISANMDTITGNQMAVAMKDAGAIGAIHRFMSIEDNVKMFQASPPDTFVSVGTGLSELERSSRLLEAGAKKFILDVAHAASEHVVDTYVMLRKQCGNDSTIVVGNFATREGIYEFVRRLPSVTKHPDAFKVGIGGGSVCETRVVTGCGVPTLGSVIDCAKTGYVIIADGGMRTSGDIVKALAAGASLVMLGGMLAGTAETPGSVIWDEEGGYMLPTGVKKYRGSASKESYAIQNKIASHRTSEGASIVVPYKGPVADVLQQIEGGIRSALSYTNSYNLQDLKSNAQFITVSNAGLVESRPHGKK